MAMRGISLMPSAVTKTLICVDVFNEQEISGRLVNLYMPQPVQFHSAYDIVNIMEKFFEQISFPQAYFEERTFTKTKSRQQERTNPKSEVHQYMAEHIFQSEQGKKATFVIQVQFRQNATWQGTIMWNEAKKEKNFRSTLEMIKLMDNAITSNEDSEVETGWE